MRVSCKWHLNIFQKKKKWIINNHVFSNTLLSIKYDKFWICKTKRQLMDMRKYFSTLSQVRQKWKNWDLSDVFHPVLRSKHCISSFHSKYFNFSNFPMDFILRLWNYTSAVSLRKLNRFSFVSQIRSAYWSR